MPFAYPGECPMSAASPSRKAIDHLNWLDDVAAAFVDVGYAAFEIAKFTLGASSDWYFRLGGGSPCVATAPTGLTVTIKAGVGFLNGVPVYIPADITTAAFTPPSSNPRIDVLCVDPANRTSYYIQEGVEAASPSAPVVVGDYIPVANIYHTVAETTIEDADDSVNGYITCLYLGVRNFTDADTTPSVAGGRVFNTPTTVAAPYVITTLHDGYAGQEVTIIGRHADCSINDAGNMKIAGAWTATPLNTITLVFGGTNWFEKCRSANA